jgi:hypothetical protein
MPTQTSVASSTQPTEPTYSRVLFAVLCSNTNATTNNFTDCSPDEFTAQIGEHVYAFSANAPTIDNVQQAIVFPATTCRSLDLRFGIPPQGDLPAGLRITVSVVQSGLAPQFATVAPNQLGRLKASLSGGAWDIDTVANMPVSGAYDLYMDGNANCSTSTGS